MNGGSAEGAGFAEGAAAQGELAVDQEAGAESSATGTREEGRAVPLSRARGTRCTVTEECCGSSARRGAARPLRDHLPVRALAEEALRAQVAEPDPGERDEVGAALRVDARAPAVRVVCVDLVMRTDVVVAERVVCPETFGGG